MTPFSKLLASAHGDGGEVTVDVTADWLQGRSVFGGLQAAVALRAMRGCGVTAPLRALQTTFIAPVGAGPLHAKGRILRAGKNVTHVEANVLDGTATAATAIGVFGWPRSSVLAVVPVAVPVVTAAPVPFRFREGVTPAFTAHFTARWLRGLPPFTGDSTLDQVVEVDLRDEGPTTEEHVLAIADFVPPVGLSHLRAPAPGSTLTWMVELLVDRVDRLGLAGWRVDPTLLAARDGYTSQSVMVWGPDGGAVAVSRQNMMVFA